MVAVFYKGGGEMNPILELILCIAITGGIIVTCCYAFALFFGWLVVKIFKRIKRKDGKGNDRGK